jgi:hypothetical protein
MSEAEPITARSRADRTNSLAGLQTRRGTHVVRVTPLELLFSPRNDQFIPGSCLTTPEQPSSVPAASEASASIIARQPRERAMEATNSFRVGLPGPKAISKAPDRQAISRATNEEVAEPECPQAGVKLHSTGAGQPANRVNCQASSRWRALQGE